MANNFDFKFDSIPEDGPLSEQDLYDQELALDPDNMINQHQERQTQANDRINESRLRRLQQENTQLSEQLATTRDTTSALAEEQAYLRGQLEGINKTTVADTADSQFDEEELAVHGHAKPFVSKVAKIEADNAIAAMEQRHNAQLQQLEAKFANELAARDQSLKAVSGTMRSNFEDDVNAAAQGLGLNISQLSMDDNFARFGAKPLAVGSSRTWGDQLEENIDNQNLSNTVNMLKQYAQHVRGPQETEANLEKPASSGKRPMTPQGRQNLERRQAYIAQAEQLTDDFIGGRYSGSQEDYQKEKSALLTKADDIPTNV